MSIRGGSHHQYVQNFEHIWIRSKGEGGRYFSKNSKIQLFLNYPRRGGVEPNWKFSPNFPVFGVSCAVAVKVRSLNVGTVPTFSASELDLPQWPSLCLFEVVLLNDLHCLSLRAGLLFDEWVDHAIKELNVEEALKSSIFAVQKPAAPKTGEEFFHV